LWLGNQ
jgi:protein-tyrosine phosphatase